jgi:dephospho-CoA kinase
VTKRPAKPPPEAGAGRPARSWINAHLPDGERPVLVLKPSPLFIVLRPLGTLILLAAAAWGAFWLHAAYPVGLPALLAAWGALTLLAARIVWQALEWAARAYIMTEKRVLRIGGVLRRSVSDVPLARIQHVVVHRAIRERLTGLGSLGFATAGTGWVEQVWVMVPRPYGLLKTVRAAIGATPPDTSDKQSGPKGTDTPGPPPSDPDAAKPTEQTAPAEGSPIVIGLAGGIGSGKTRVAAAFKELGFLVSDSDAAAREALGRAQVRDTLVSWWGREILDNEGTVDRRKVAQIVFSDPQQRLRLEGLIHPLVRQSREELLREAGSRGAPGVVVDAPLLFEAGVDAECDAVVFVHAPRQVRLERVRASRGWDETELDRREAAQWPESRKREKSGYVLENTGDEEQLRARVKDLAHRIRCNRGAAGGVP